jgi:hypothetical protein
VELRVDRASVPWPSNADLESAVRALLAGEAHAVELRASPWLALVALRHPDGHVMLEYEIRPTGKAPSYISCLAGTLDRRDLDAAFVLFNNDRTEELARGFLWASSRPPVAARPDLGFWQWMLIGSLPGLIRMLEELLRIKHH